jgi:hypothetical protein
MSGAVPAVRPQSIREHETKECPMKIKSHVRGGPSDPPVIKG